MTFHPLLTFEVVETAAMALHEDMEASMTVHTRRNDRWEDLSAFAQQAIRRRAAIAINAVLADLLKAERQSCILVAKNAILALPEDQRRSGDLCHEVIARAIGRMAP